MSHYFRPAYATPRIYLYREPVDFRKSFRGLAAIVEQELGHTPFDGGLYAFTNRQRNKIKCLYWEDNCFLCSITKAWRKTGYNRVCRDNNITRIGCWDHARRKFVEASKAAPAKKKGDKVRKADIAISKIRKLYAIEERIKDLAPEPKTVQRQRLSKPVLDDLKAWLEKHIRRVPKDSLTWTAMNYTLNQWDLLLGYCEDGRLHISNALAENAIRPFAVGRRNWLFSDTPRGARASATCYSLIESAKANSLEPYEYLCHVLQHIGTADTVEKLEALLPWNMT